MGNIGGVLASVISLVFGILTWAIIIRVLLSWLPMAGVRIDPYNPLIRFLYALTDPILEPLRRYTTVGMIDLSPIVAIVLLNLIRELLVSLLTGL
jgi:YggT family protein